MKKTTTTITAKQIAIAVAAVCASLSMPALANENKAMLDLMLKKGVITPFFSIRSSIALLSFATAGIDSEAQTAATAIASCLAVIVVVVFFM